MAIQIEHISLMMAALTKCVDFTNPAVHGTDCTEERRKIYLEF